MFLYLAADAVRNTEHIDKGTIWGLHVEAQALCGKNCMLESAWDSTASAAAGISFSALSLAHSYSTLHGS